MKNNLNTIIYDLNKYPLSNRNGTYGGEAGAKEGILINSEYWIVKYPKNTESMKIKNLSYTTSPLSEYIGSHIYELLGYNVHETILGIRKGKLVVACKDFCKKEGSLREIRTLKNIYNEQVENMLDKEINTTGSSHIVQLNELMIHLNNNPILSKIDGLKNHFWECVLIDGLIKNNDRNNGNWGLLYEKGNYIIAPIFDNGGAFSSKISDEKIKNIVSDEKKMIDNSNNVLTAYGNGAHHYNLKELLNKVNEPELKEALIKVVPMIENKIDDISEFVNNIPNTKDNILICSNIRKEFYIKGIKIRLNDILLPAYKKARGD